MCTALLVLLVMTIIWFGRMAETVQKKNVGAHLHAHKLLDIK